MVESELAYPVGQLKSDIFSPITIKFVHYKTFEQAKQKWEERKSRINYSNLFFLMECYNCFYEEEYQSYLKLPLSHNKAVLIHSPEAPREDVHLVSCEVGTKENPIWSKILDIKENGRRALDDFDYVSFLNKK